MAQQQPTRPDLSFITSQKFENYNEMYQFVYDLEESQQDAVFNAIAKLPELLQICEMYFDQNLKNSDSVAFKVVEQTLNGIIPNEHLQD
jgi:hypothetical protein